LGRALWAGIGPELSEKFLAEFGHKTQSFLKPGHLFSISRSWQLCFAYANIDLSKSYELALVGMYTFIMLYFFTRGSYIWLCRFQKLVEENIGTKINLHT